MALMLELPENFSLNEIPKKIDICEILIQKRWSELKKIPICIDSYGQVTAYFEDIVWDCSPFSVGKGSQNDKKNFYFSSLSESPGLLLQAKIIVYGWLYHASNKTGKTAKISTLATRFNNHLRRILDFLVHKNIDDIASLSEPDLWNNLKEFLKSKKYSRGTLEHTFSALESISSLRNWLPFNLNLPEFDNKLLSKQLAPANKQEDKQILAIPQRIADLLYGEAITLVELAWPHRKILSLLECELQYNFTQGKMLTDELIFSNKTRYHLNAKEEFAPHLYQSKINKMMPQSYTDIILHYLNNTGLLPDKKINGKWYSNWLSQIQVACFICCGAFTGMRVSELFELYDNSFFVRELNGQKFSVVRGAHLKLVSGGKKHEEWLASPVVKKAIELATAISTNQRHQLQALAKIEQTKGHHGKASELRNNANCLWLVQRQRSSKPAVIQRTDWNTRLRRFTQNIGAIVNQADVSECLRINPCNNGAIEDKIQIGQHWPLTTHQFRRTFAVFCVRNHLGHPIALKQQFKHLYLRMSEWYGNGGVLARVEDATLDMELQKMLDEVSIERTVAEYDRWHNGDEILSGGYGKAILAMRNDKPVIYSSWKNLYRLVKERRLTLHGTLHSYCKNSYQCDMEGVINPAFCSNCSNSIIDEEKARWWQLRHQALTQYIATQNELSINEYSHYITQIRAAEKVMSDFNLPFETYKHPLEIVQL